MEKKIRRSSPAASLFIFILITALISHNLVIPVMSSTTTIEDQKNFFPDPRAGSPPSVPSYGSPPPHGSGGGGYGSSPPPSHTTPSHGGGGGYNPTPSTPSGRNCGSPPHHDPSPTPSAPSTPSNPPSHGGGGGYYNPPPSHEGGSPPATPTDPGTPNVPSSPPYVPSPSPSPFTGTCSYWRNHPGMIWGLLGWWGTLGSAFGGTGTIPGFSGAGMSLPQALSNTRTDGLGALYREGTASFLNSLVNTKFPYTTNQVRDRFVASIGSNKAAAAQAHLFRMANEGRMKP
ncbi:hypothetical protein QN277_018602 [Acacia crassicarpa]|uniref:Protodermal factor 1 n=1 Tax=Acacia crassicarpa TaxID=499986 RepID=A0AAE1JTV4_9FABA|nr:hypothetical protein QN277_018602 [Acacia crassicarpa]